jgi:hypothetical protein
MNNVESRKSKTPSPSTLTNTVLIQFDILCYCYYSIDIVTCHVLRATFLQCTYKQAGNWQVATRFIEKFRYWYSLGVRNVRCEWALSSEQWAAGSCSCQLPRCHPFHTHPYLIMMIVMGVRTGNNKKYEQNIKKKF